MQHLKSISVSYLSFLPLHRYCESNYSQAYKQLVLCSDRGGNVSGWASEVSQARVPFPELCHVADTGGTHC